MALSRAERNFPALVQLAAPGKFAEIFRSRSGGPQPASNACPAPVHFWSPQPDCPVTPLLKTAASGSGKAPPGFVAADSADPRSMACRAAARAPHTIERAQCKCEQRPLGIRKIEGRIREISCYLRWRLSYRPGNWM